MTGRLLSDLTDGRLQWTTLGDVYDEFYYPDNFRIDFPDSPRAFRENLVKAFPEEHRAIDRYLAYAGEVAKAMNQAQGCATGLAVVFVRIPTDTDVGSLRSATGRAGLGEDLDREVDGDREGRTVECTGTDEAEEEEEVVVLAHDLRHRFPPAIVFTSDAEIEVWAHVYV